MSPARVPLLEPADWPEAARALAEGPFGALNVMKALMHHPDLFRRWSVFANHFLFKGALPVREREILILRVAWLVDCEYEWAQHVKISADACGFDVSTLKAIQTGEIASLWSEADAVLLRLTDAIVEGPALTDRTWDDVRRHWDDAQAIEAIALVGNYVMLAMALNTLRVPPDPGFPGFDAGTPPRPGLTVAPRPMSAPQPPARVEPIRPQDLPTDAREILARARGPLPSVNVIDTVAHHSGLLKRWLPFFSHCLHKQSLDLRQRELVILRTGWLAGSAYEWAQHVPIALDRGVTPDEIELIQALDAYDEWHGTDRALIEATDRLMARFTLDDTEWRRLARSVATPKALDLIFTVGQYRLVAGLLHGLNVQLDDYLRFPPHLE